MSTGVFMRSPFVMPLRKPLSNEQAISRRRDAPDHRAAARTCCRAETEIGAGQATTRALRDPLLGKDERTSNQQTDQARLGRRQLVASCDLALLPTLARPSAEAIEMLKAWNVVRAMTALVAPKRKSLARNKTLDGTFRYSWGSTRHSEVAATRLMRGLRRCRISVPTGASGARGERHSRRFTAVSLSKLRLAS